MSGDNTQDSSTYTPPLGASAGQERSGGLGIILVGFDFSANDPAPFHNEGDPPTFRALGVVRMNKLKFQMRGKPVPEFAECGQWTSREKTVT